MDNADRENVPVSAGDQRVVIDDLIAALEPFTDVANEGTDDYPDDFKVDIAIGRCTYYALTLGHFRRAQNAIARAEGRS